MIFADPAAHNFHACMNGIVFRAEFIVLQNSLNEIILKIEKMIDHTPDDCNAYLVRVER